MRKPDPPFPSFVSMSHQLQKDTLRLPDYRESILLRFHPYPQTQRKSTKPATGKADPLMQSVDYRYTTEPVTLEGKRGGFEPHDDSVSDESTADKTVLDLDHAVNTKDGVQVLRRHSLTSLIIDLALAMKAKTRRTASKLGRDS